MLACVDAWVEATVSDASVVASVEAAVLACVDAWVEAAVLGNVGARVDLK